MLEQVDGQCIIRLITELEDRSMTDTPSAQGKNADPTPNEPRLESWGEIASYLRRDIRTVQRWEKEQGLPVRRLKIGKLGQVYAYRSELDKWILERQPRADAEEPSGAKDAPQSGQDGFRGIEFDERKNQKKNKANRERQDI